MMSYEEYLKLTNQRDSFDAWKWWKIDVCGMTELQAIKAGLDKDFGYSPLQKKYCKRRLNFSFLFW
jgi:hypothetical protein